MADQTLAKFVNERSILTLLRLNGGASRAAISRALSLTPATISRLTADMLKRGLLRETDAPPAPSREPGRPGIGLSVNPSGGFFMGVEIGVSALRFVLIDLCANVAEAREEPQSRKITPAEAARAIARVHAEFASDPRYQGKIGGGGVTVPGLVTEAGFIVNLPILGWRETSLAALLAKVPGPQLKVRNNSSAAAFGAVYTRPELQAPCTVFLKLGTGCGGAAIVGGRLLRGADGTGMEFGHINLGPLNEAGPDARCNCGQTGCLETRVNLAALSRAYRGAEPDPGDTFEDLPAEVARAFAAGDVAAIRAVQGLAGHLSRGLGSLVNIFNPSRVIFGGAMRPVLECGLQEIRAEVAQRIIPGTRMPVLTISHLGPFECAIGAACLAHHAAFDISNLDLGAEGFEGRGSLMGG